MKLKVLGNSQSSAGPISRLEHLIGLSQTMAYVGFYPRIGLYFFTAGVILNNIATLRLSFSRWKPAS